MRQVGIPHYITPQQNFPLAEAPLSIINQTDEVLTVLFKENVFSYSFGNHEGLIHLTPQAVSQLSAIVIQAPQPGSSLPRINYQYK